MESFEVKNQWLASESCAVIDDIFSEKRRRWIGFVEFARTGRMW